MSKFKFERKDFSSDWSRGHSDFIATRANEVLQKHLDSLPVVYGSYILGAGQTAWTQQKLYTDSQKAIIFNCEPIEKKACVHEPILQLDGVPDKWVSTIVIGGARYRCKHCNAKLKATWSVE